MANRMLMTGINTYPSCPLQGCVNDIKNVTARLLTPGDPRYGFQPAEITTLLDNDATTANLKSALQAFVSGVSPLDRLYFHYSGHGATADDCDLPGQFQNCICPVDFDFSLEKMITDKFFHQLFSTLPNGVIFDWCSDSCLVGATKIPLLNGTEKSIADMQKEGGSYWVYSCRDNGEVVPGLAHSARITGKRRIIRVILDNDEIVECTEDHPFMMRDGSYKNSGELISGNSLMPLYRKLENDGYLKGYELSLTSRKWRGRNGKGNIQVRRVWVPTHLIVRDYFNMKQDKTKSICHHKDFNKNNNQPDNLVMVSWYEHKRMHGEVGKRNLLKTWADPEFIAWHKSDEYKEEQAARIKEKWADPSHRESHTNANRTRYERDGLPQKFVEAMIVSNERMKTDGEYRQRLFDSLAVARKTPGTKAYKLFHSGVLEDNLRKAQRKGLWYSAYLKHYNLQKEDFSFAEWKAEQTDVLDFFNHKVVKVEHTDREEIVYDLTVEEHHNFALSSGIFVHNCHSADLDRIITKRPHRTRLFAGSKDRAGQTRTISPGALPNVGLISGCGFAQTSADSQDPATGQPCGAFTWALLQSLSKLTVSTSKVIISQTANRILSQHGYTQQSDPDGGRADRPFNQA